MLNTNEHIKVSDCLGNDTHQQVCQQHSAGAADNPTERSVERCFAEKQTADPLPACAKSAEDSNFAAPSHDGSSDRVVDQKHADQQGNHAESGKVQLKTCQHLLYLLAALFGRLDENVRRKKTLKLLANRTWMIRIANTKQHGRQFALELKQLLSPTDIHYREPILSIFCLQDKTQHEPRFAPVYHDSDRISPFQMMCDSKLTGNCGSRRIAEPRAAIQ